MSRQSALLLRFNARSVARFPRLRSERLDDHQYDDRDHQNCRYFIDLPVKYPQNADFCPGRIPLRSLQNSHACRTEPKPAEISHRAIPPRRTFRQQAKIRPVSQTKIIAGCMIILRRRLSMILNVSESCEPEASVRMIDEETREIEHSRHPGNHRDDVKSLEPGKIVSHRISPPAMNARHQPLDIGDRRLRQDSMAQIHDMRTACKSRRITSIPSSRARPPARSASGSRLPCVARPAENVFGGPDGVDRGIEPDCIDTRKPRNLLQAASADPRIGDDFCRGNLASHFP